MQLVSFQTHYGQATTMSTRSTMPTNDLDSYEGKQISRSEVALPTIYEGNTSAPEDTITYLKPKLSSGAGHSDSSRVERSIANIVEIIAGMDEAEANKAKNELTHNQRAGVEQIYRMMEWSTMTVADVVEDIKAGTFGGPNQAKTDRSRQMQAALINGTAKVVDMEEFGYRTEASFNVHFDGAGNFAGASTSHQRGGDFDLRKFYDEHLIKQPDGRVIDGETGHNSNRIQIGGLDIFVTWP